MIDLHCAQFRSFRPGKLFLINTLNDHIPEPGRLFSALKLTKVVLIVAPFVPFFILCLPFIACFLIDIISLSRSYDYSLYRYAVSLFNPPKFSQGDGGPVFTQFHMHCFIYDQNCASKKVTVIFNLSLRESLNKF